MSPREHHTDYDEATTVRCERALVTLLGDLGPWRERIYLVGGLAPRYLVGQLPEGAHGRTSARPTSTWSSAWPSVAGLLPYAVLKILAFQDRHENKDAYDLVFTLNNHPGGSRAAGAAAANSPIAPHANVAEAGPS